MMKHRLLGVLSKCIRTKLTLFTKLEIAQEAARKIRRYYRNLYKYGPSAKTICK